jgi:hypothetical protein
MSRGRARAARPTAARPTRRSDPETGAGSLDPRCATRGGAPDRDAPDSLAEGVVVHATSDPKDGVRQTRPRKPRPAEASRGGHVCTTRSAYRDARLSLVRARRYVAPVSNAGDRPRFLHRNASRNYTENPHLSARHEPEAVSEREQRELTARARRRWEQEQARAWGRAAGQIDDALAEFVRDGRPSPQLLSDVRAIERATQRADRHLGMG